MARSDANPTSWIMVGLDAPNAAPHSCSNWAVVACRSILLYNSKGEPVLLPQLLTAASVLDALGGDLTR